MNRSDSVVTINPVYNPDVKTINPLHTLRWEIDHFPLPIAKHDVGTISQT
jgi:hypothetical protein